MRITNSTKNTHNKRKKRKRYYDEPLCSLASSEFNHAPFILRLALLQNGE